MGARAAFHDVVIGIRDAVVSRALIPRPRTSPQLFPQASRQQATNLRNLVKILPRQNLVYQARWLEPRARRLLSLISRLLWQNGTHLHSDLYTADERLAFTHLVFGAHTSAE